MKLFREVKKCSKIKQSSLSEEEMKENEEKKKTKDGKGKQTEN